MTEAFEDGNYLVRVRAQVMIRDDSTGGWVPMGGGGLSNVSVRKRVVPSEVDHCKHEYFIFGKRISDQSVVLSCTIKKDFEYNKVMPTFHHWKTGEKKFGLTFQTAADARAFDKGLRTAVDELVDGIADASPVLNKNPGDVVVDDDVFMRRLRCTPFGSNGGLETLLSERRLWRKTKENRFFHTKTLNLPSDHGDSRSSSDSSIRGSIHTTPTQEQILPRGHFIGCDRLDSEHESPSSNAEHYPYVQLTSVRDYFYQNMEESRVPQHDSSESLKKRSFENIPPLTGRPSRKQMRRSGRQRCRYCQELFAEEDNKKGACEYAPDCVRTAVDEIACIRCARCMFYHCMADAEGEFEQHPCECRIEDGCGRRWLGLGLLSILIPCLWLYPPLRACHWCGVRCGLCGGRHRPAS